MEIATKVLPQDGIAWQTLQKFNDVRKVDQSEDLRLLQLVKKFRDLRCLDRKDRVFALRGLAKDGQQLVVKYEESFGSLYFRILSMLPTEWILPVMTGYRWPHEAAKELIMAMDLIKNDLLDSLLDSTDDILFTVFEYVGTVVKVEDSSQGRNGAEVCGAFSSYFHQIQIQGSTTRLLYGRKAFKRTLYVALASDRAHRSVVGLLLHEPHDKAIVHWQNMQLTEQRMMLIEETLIYGVLRCMRNLSAKNSYRVLCHISRKALVLLWLLEIGEMQHLYDHERSLSNPEAKQELLCCCLQGQINTVTLSEQNTAYRNCHLEILPNFPTTYNDKQWKTASIQPWRLPTSPSLLRDRGEDVWEFRDAVDFRAHRSTPLNYAAKEGHAAFFRDLLSKLAIGSNRKGDASQPTLLSSSEDNYSGVEEPLSYTDKVTLNEADDHGRTALSWAAEAGHEAAVKLLVERDDVADSNKHSPFYTPSVSPVSWVRD